MRIQMCDGCKQVYKPYARLEDNGVVYEGNGFSLLVIDRDGKKRPTYTGDLCPECMLKLRDFLRDGLGINTAKKEKPETIKDKDGETGEVVAEANYVSGGEIQDA